MPFFWVGVTFLQPVHVGRAVAAGARDWSSDDELSRVLAVVLMSAGSFYLSIPYTESLFLLLVVATMAAARKGRYELAGCSPDSRPRLACTDSRCSRCRPSPAGSMRDSPPGSAFGAPR